MANFTITQNEDEIIKEITDENYFGNVFYDDPGGSKTLNLNGEIKAADGTGDRYRGFIEFDISALKHVSSVDDIWLVAFVHCVEGGSDISGIRDGQPSTTTDAATIWGWMTSATTYSTDSYTTECFMPNWCVQLNAQARTDLLANLSGSSDYFALCIRLINENFGSSTDDEFSIYSNFIEYGEPPKAILWVEYTVNNVVTITQPRVLDRINSRNIENHKFKSGGYENKDIGGDGKTIRMSGKEWDAGSETSLSNIDDMAELGKPITLSGFADASLNDTWLIEEFEWHKVEGTDDTYYEWDLTLIKPSG